MWTLLAGGVMGWGLGANDAANLFGPAVESRALRFWTAAAWLRFLSSLVPSSAARAALTLMEQSVHKP